MLTVHGKHGVAAFDPVASGVETDLAGEERVNAEQRAHRIAWSMRPAGDLTVADLDGDRDLDLAYSGRTIAGGAVANGVYVHWNVTRHLRLSGLIAVGGYLDVDVQSALGLSDPSRIALTTIGFARGRRFVPGVGAILIDVNGAVSMPWAAFRGSDTARSRVPIPLVRSLIGLELFVQAATLGAAGTAAELTHVAVGRVHG